MKLGLGSVRCPGCTLTPDVQKFLHSELGEQVAVLAKGIEDIEQVEIPRRQNDRIEIIGRSDHLGKDALVEREKDSRATLGLNSAIEREGG